MRLYASGHLWDSRIARWWIQTLCNWDFVKEMLLTPKELGSGCLLKDKAPCWRQRIPPCFPCLPCFLPLFTVFTFFIVCSYLHFLAWFTNLLALCCLYFFWQCLSSLSFYLFNLFFLVFLLCMFILFTLFVICLVCPLYLVCLEVGKVFNSTWQNLGNSRISILA